jgi:NADH:ubiquinone oxidoreductase subunit 5 (subunit L)/multisubunit Na+/H+ antiporter MnhA subunit
LAYSSIEHIGLISLAFGVGYWGQATGRPLAATLGFAAGVLHIWNHALMKGLMFLSAGSVVHGTGTRDIEQLGGLLRRMPYTGRAMLFGSVAISAIAPLNGFVGKWLLYLALLECAVAQPRESGLVSLLAIGLLILMGGLAALAFVRLTGIALLGAPRSQAAQAAHESSSWLLAPMTVLAVGCLVMALAPFWALDAANGVVEQLVGGASALTNASLAQTRGLLISLAAVHAALFTVSAVGLAWATRFIRRTDGTTWGCGYAQPTARMQYTGQSFAELMTEQLLPHSLGPDKRHAVVRGIFPERAAFTTESNDPFCRRIYEPFFDRWARRCARLRILQQGQINLYLSYIVLTVIVALAWMSLRTWWRAI